MELTAVLNSVHVISVIGEVQRKDVEGIFYDSRDVIKNSVFVAIKGYKTDGHRYILDAINKGALAIVLEENDAVPDDIFIHTKVAKILVHNSRKALAEISHFYYKEPSTKMKVIGITGTNGKTTTTYFIKNILEAAGNKVGLFGTIKNMIGSREIKSSLTTPESNDLAKIMFDMHNEGCSYVVMEVSSHSLVLDRVYKINFNSAVLTNITSDHLDFHGTFESYFEAKKILFDSLTNSAFGVYNIDDNNSSRFVANSTAKLFSYGKTSDADVFIKDINYDLEGTKFTITYKGKDYKASTVLAGEFNAYNAAAAFSVAVLNDISPETALEGIRTTKHVPGRFEVVGSGAKKAIIDYSHTADSLEKALTALREIIKDKREIVTVFGCGGNRDVTKRPVMGKIASELSDKIIVTSDNPRNENPFEIINQIKNGITKNNFVEIESREEAIKYAIENSAEDAVILIAGKGHEEYQEAKGVKSHFSDKETAEKYLNK